MMQLYLELTLAPSFGQYSGTLILQGSRSVGAARYATRPQRSRSFRRWSGHALTDGERGRGVVGQSRAVNGASATSQVNAIIEHICRGWTRSCAMSGPFTTGTRCFCRWCRKWGD